jgi:hypothetical protein
VTTYFHLEGTLSKEVGGENQPITDRAEYTFIVNRILQALAVYAREDLGFRFVDIDAHGTIAEGNLSLNWSDYGLDRKRDD